MLISLLEQLSAVSSDVWKADKKNLQQSGLLRCSHCGINHLSLELKVTTEQRYKALVSVSAVKSFAELSDCPCYVKVLALLGGGMGTASSDPLLWEQLLGKKTLHVEILTQICACVCIYMVQESLLLSRNLLQEQHAQNPLTLLLKCR